MVWPKGNRVANAYLESIHLCLQQEVEITLRRMLGSSY